MKMQSRAWRTCLAALAAAGAVAPHQAAATDTATREWRFQVSLDGRHIGEHSFLLRGSGDSRELTSEARFRVRVLFYDAYRYDHRAQETWRGDCLERLDASTDENGKRTVVAVTPLDECVQTFAYWNPTILTARRLLNPQTGEYVPVQVRDLGSEVIAGRPTERFRLTGGGRTPLQIDLWYSPAREWLALESLTPEGRRLRYSKE
jgi:uncharacterized protein DUF6134